MTAYVHGTESEEQERLRTLNKLTNPSFLAFLAPRPAEHILEVGSGLGILAEEVATMTSRGRVVGIEYALEQLSKVAVNRTNLEFVRCDAHTLPFADATFNAAYCRYLLEHVADAIQVVAEMRRVLKSGGRVCIQENDIAVFRMWPECPTWTKLWSNFGRLQGLLGGDAYIGRKLYSILKAAGFDGIELSLHPEFHYAGMPTFKLWIKNAFLILEASGSALIRNDLATPAELKTARYEIENFITLSDASSYFYWNRARAFK